MWRLNVNEPERDSYWVELKPGATSLGRSSQNTIPLQDSSASRQHAEVLWDNVKDSISIGRAILHLTNESGDLRRSVMGTHFFTREIVLESLDEHAVLIDEVAQK